VHILLARWPFIVDAEPVITLYSNAGSPAELSLADFGPFIPVVPWTVILLSLGDQVVL